MWWCAALQHSLICRTRGQQCTTERQSRRIWEYWARRGVTDVSFNRTISTICCLSPKLPLSTSDAATLDVSRLQCCAIALNAAHSLFRNCQFKGWGIEASVFCLAFYFCLWSFEVGATSSCFSHSNLGLMWPTNGPAWNPICDLTLSCQTKDQFRWSTVEEIKDKSKTLAWVCLQKFTFLFLRLFLFPISLFLVWIQYTAQKY